MVKNYNFGGYFMFIEGFLFFESCLNSGIKFIYSNLKIWVLVMYVCFWNWLNFSIWFDGCWWLERFKGEI